MNELTPYERWQQETKGNILREPQFNPDGSVEAGEEEMKRFAEWSHMKAEQELLEYEQMFNHD